MTKLLFFIVFLGLTAANPIGEDEILPLKQAKLQQDLFHNVLNHAPRGARLVNYYGTGPLTSAQILASLPDNATLIRPDIIGGFDCSNRIYGYYADTNNDCQIFHICLNYHQLFPKLFQNGIYMQFSFICPKYTIFTQDAMVCAWEASAVPCEYAPSLYYLNKNFFKKTPKDVKKIIKKPETAEAPAEAPAETAGTAEIAVEAETTGK